MALRKIFAFTHLPMYNGYSGTPEYGFVMNPYGIVKASSNQTRVYISNNAELTLAVLPGNQIIQTPLVYFNANTLTDGTSRKSIIGFRMYHGYATGTFISIGGLALTPAEIGLQIDIRTHGIELVWDRVAKTISVYVDNVFKLMKSVGAAVYVPGTEIILSTTYTNGNDSSAPRKYSDFYFIDDTEDDSICDRLGNPYTYQLPMVSEIPGGWATSNGVGIKNALGQVQYEGNAPTLYSPVAYPSTDWGPVKITHAATIPKYSSVFAVQSVFSIKRSYVTAATLDISYADSEGTKAAPSLFPQYGAATASYHESMSAVETNSQNKEWTVDQANTIAIIFQQREA